MFSRLGCSLEEMEGFDKAVQWFRNTRNFIDYREEELCCQSLSKCTANFKKGQAN